MKRTVLSTPDKRYCVFWAKYKSVSFKRRNHAKRFAQGKTRLKTIKAHGRRYG